MPSSNAATHAFSPWIIAGAALLLAATLALYSPARHFPFLTMNDGEYVAENVRIQHFDRDFLMWSFTTFHAANWHPLTWLSHALDYQLFGLDAGRHHEMNLLLHAVNVLLLFWVLWRATGYAGRSLMVAALFALHPMNVESVAWVAERKNVLSMMFLLLALGAYRWYATRPRIGRYSVVAALYALGLMAKPQVVTLPFLLLLWDYWPLKRVAIRHSLFAFRQNGSRDPSGERRMANGEWRSSGEQRPFMWLVLEKLPLLALSAASAIVTVYAQRAGGAMGGAVRSYSLTVRVENAIVSYARYLGKAVWPTHLAFFYPHPRAFGFMHVAVAALLLLVITGVVLLFPQRRYLLVGWLWFLGSLVPMIGLLQVGGQAMADRYAYLPFVGLFIALCWGAADWAEQRRMPMPLQAGACVVVLSLLAIFTHRQLASWSSDVAVWSHAAEATGNNAAAENMLGEALRRAGDVPGAVAHFRVAAAADPLLPYPRYHIGVYEADQGRTSEALAQFQQVIALTQSDRGVLAPLRADTYLRMATAYEALGDPAEAERCTRFALEEQRKARSFEASTNP